MECLWHGWRLGLGRRHGNRDQFDDRCRHTGPRYVRSVKQETCLDRKSDQDDRGQQEPGEKRGAFGQGHGKAAEGFSAETEIGWQPEPRRVTGNEACASPGKSGYAPGYIIFW